MNTDSKICLVVIYNHNFEKNIPVIRRMYSGRFSKVIQIMPFYRGDDSDVVGVYDASYQFNGYIAQAAKILQSQNCGHYIFVADDMVINPKLNESNICERLELDGETSLTTELSMLTARELFSWAPGRAGAMFMNAAGRACEWRRHMPNEQEARARFEVAGLDWREGITLSLLRFVGLGLRVKRLDPWYNALLPMLGNIRRFQSFFKAKNTTIESSDYIYPTAWGYSDFFVVPRDALDDFCHYCGVMASARQWVECAIPTALILACKRVRTISAVGWKCEAGVFDFSVREEIERKNDLSYTKFIANFPEDYLFIHPIKLSKWKDLP